MGCSFKKEIFIGACCGLIGIMIGAFCCICAINSSGSSKYLNVYPYLLANHIENSVCARLMESSQKSYDCELVGYGISESDNVPYVRYSYQEIDPAATEIKYLGDKQYKTLYFWQDESKKNQADLMWGFSESQSD